MAVIGLLIGDTIALFNPSPQSRNDFMWTAMLLLTGFSLLSLVGTLFVEKKVNNKLFSIKNSLLYLTKDNYFADKYLATKKVIKDPFIELDDVLFQMREYFVEYEQLINKKYQILNQREKMRALDHLSTSIAHEINNPLAGILGHAQLAKSKAVALPLQKHLDIIEKEIRKVKDFTRDLLKFSKNIPLDCKEMNINQVILETIDLMEIQLKDKNIQVRKNLTSKEDALIDALQIQQVFVNIINNAIYAMERSEERILTVYTEDVKNGVRIQISDTGVGVSKGIENKIFEPFFTTKKPQEGKGLGLSVCFGLIKGHKGNIHLKSKTIKGSTFVIDLPYPENLRHQENTLSEDTASFKPSGLEQESSLIGENRTPSQEVASLVNKPVDQIEKSEPSVFYKKTLEDIKTSFPEDKKHDAVSDLQEKLKASNQLPKVKAKSPDMDGLDLDVSLHKSLSQPLKIDPLAAHQGSGTKMVYKGLDQTEPKEGIDLQLDKDLMQEELPNEEKANFFIDKHAIVNKKRVEFKVKIRPSKIKDK